LNSLALSAQWSVLVFGASSAVVSVSMKGMRSEFGLDYSGGGMLATVRSLTLAVVVTACGFLAGRWGKKPLLTTGALLLAVALAAVYVTNSLAALLVAFVLFGAGLGTIEALVSPLVAELDPPRAASNLNALHAVFPVGLAVTALVGGEALTAGLEWRSVYLALCPAAMVSGVLFLLVRFPPHLPAERVADSALSLGASGVFWLLGLAMALSAWTESCLTVWTANFITDSFGASARSGALGLAAFAAPMFAGRMLASRAARTIRLERLIIASSLVGAGGVLGLVLVAGKEGGSASLAASCGFLGVCGLAIAPFWPTLLALAGRRIPGRTTMLLALMATFGIAGYGLAPWTVGLLADRWGLRAGFAAMIPVLLAVIVLTRIAAGRGRSASESLPARGRSI